MDPTQPAQAPVAEAPAPVREPQQEHQQQIQESHPEYPEHQVQQVQQVQQDQSDQMDHTPQPLSHSEPEVPTIVPIAAPEESTLPPASYHNGYSSDSRAHYDYHTPAQDPQPQAPTSSRPSSGLSVTQNQKQPSQSTKNSVVIKVGMVGDAQIGKTSLMVKYVEGSWDEDYIQTLGRSHRRGSDRCPC